MTLENGPHVYLEKHRLIHGGVSIVMLVFRGVNPWKNMSVFSKLTAAHFNIDKDVHPTTPITTFQ